MPLDTLRRMLIGADEPALDVALRESGLPALDVALRESGLSRQRHGWTGVLDGDTVTVQCGPELEHIRVWVECDTTLQLRAPGAEPPTGDDVFDAVLSVPPAQHADLTPASRARLVELAAMGRLHAETASLAWSCPRDLEPERVVHGARTLSRVATALRNDQWAIRELETLRGRPTILTESDTRKLCVSERASDARRAHGKALTVSGAKLEGFVARASVPARARCWAAERLEASGGAKVVGQMLRREPVAGDLPVLALLRDAENVLGLLASAPATWSEAAALVAIGGTGRHDASSPQARAWVFELAPALPGLPPPARQAVLHAIVALGPPRAIQALRDQLKADLSPEVAASYREALADLRDRHSRAGAVSMVPDSGGLSMAIPPSESH